MRLALVLPLLLAACGDGPAPAPAKQEPEAKIQVIDVPLHAGKIMVDGNSADAIWKTARRYKLKLSGNGPETVTLRAARNEIGLYFLLQWQDPEITRGNQWKFEAPGEWKLHQGEDAALFFFPPPEASAAFADTGLAPYVKEGRLFHAGREGFADIWYWGAQTTRPTLQARDHWMPAGQHMRGDKQPADSDNTFNFSLEYKGPAAVPKKIDDTASWYLPAKNRQALTGAKMVKLADERSFGWTVSAVIHRPRKGSRGDVLASSRHAGKAWALELGRRFDTGYRDDQVLASGVRFCLVLFNGTARGARIGEYGVAGAISEPLELRFVSTP